MEEKIKEIAQVMEGCAVFDGKTGITDGKILLIFPGEIAVQLRPQNGVKRLARQAIESKKSAPIFIPIIKNLPPCKVCEGLGTAAAVDCQRCEGIGETVCSECGSTCDCRECKGGGYRKAPGVPCYDCLNVGVEGELLPVKVPGAGFISAKYAAFLQKYFGDLAFYSCEAFASWASRPIYFESAHGGACGLVMGMNNIDPEKAYKE